ncbi:MAG: hydrogenase maturation nickel metallochaperone HypA [Nocardioidaceae bacterium]
MHELSLCGSIYELAERAADGRPVAVINLQIGQLRQVVPDTLRYCWTLVSDQTDLGGSTLEIDSVPVTLRCHECDSDTALTDHLLLICGGCGGTQVQVTTGEEFVLTSLELAEV